jgi:hypothetical protein
MKKLVLILPFIIALAACGSNGGNIAGGGTGTGSGATGPTPTPPAGTPDPVAGQWAIVTQSTVMPGQATTTNFDMAPVVVTFNGYQFGAVGSTNPPGSVGMPILAAISPYGSFGWSYPQCLPYGTVNSAQNCPTVTISGFVGTGTPTGISVTITGTSSNVTLDQAVLTGTMNAGGTTMTGTYTANSLNTLGQVTVTDSGTFFATALTPTSVAGSYVGTVAIETCNSAGANCSSPQNANLSLAYTGTLGAAGGTVQFSFQGSAVTATLTTPMTKTINGGLFTIGLTDPAGAGAGTLEYVPGVTFSAPPVANPASNALLVNFTIPNGGGIYAVRGFLTPGNVLPVSTPSIGSAASFTYNAGVITQTPLVTFSPATPVASTAYCASGCSQLGTVATPVSLSITISQPVTQGSLRVLVLDTTAPATANCSPAGQIAACSYTNYPGNGIYIGDFTPGGGFTLQGVIPGGNTIEPMDNMEVVIVNPTGSWTGAVNWQLNH